MILKCIITNQNTLEMKHFKKSRRTLNCTAKTLKVIRENWENLLCV